MTLLRREYEFFGKELFFLQGEYFFLREEFIILEIVKDVDPPKKHPLSITR